MNLFYGNGKLYRQCRDGAVKELIHNWSNLIDTLVAVYYGDDVVVVFQKMDDDNTYIIDVWWNKSGKYYVIATYRRDEFYESVMSKINYMKNTFIDDNGRFRSIYTSLLVDLYSEATKTDVILRLEKKQEHCDDEDPIYKDLAYAIEQIQNDKQFSKHEVQE